MSWKTKRFALSISTKMGFTVNDEITFTVSINKASTGRKLLVGVSNDWILIRIKG